MFSRGCFRETTIFGIQSTWKPCATLQYADDTIILCRAQTSDILELKSCLDLFAQATGLQINFSKSTLATLHTDDSLRSALAQTLQYKLENFPLTYLGLPLSLSKLRTCDLQPTIAKADKFLAGWQAKLLSYAEAIILVTRFLTVYPSMPWRPPNFQKAQLRHSTKKEIVLMVRRRLL